MKAIDIERRIQMVQKLQSLTRDTNTLATLNRCLEKLVMMDPEDEPHPGQLCAVCKCSLPYRQGDTPPVGDLPTAEFLDLKKVKLHRGRFVHRRCV